MAYGHQNIGLLLVVLACATAHALGQAVQFVPQGCSGLKLASSAQFSGNSIQGTVTLSNPNTFNVPITKVQVMLANNIPVAPMYVTANCGGATAVPFSPIPYQLGTLTCYFTAALPSNGPAASPNAWTSVRATATIGMSGATCDSPMTPISGYVPPPSPTPPPSTTCPSPIQLTTSLGVDHKTVYGTVTFSNWGYANIHLSGVTYQLNPSIGNAPVAPIYGNVKCLSLTVPWNPTVGAAGTLKCTFTADVSKVPSNIRWSGALVKATLVGGHVCPSPVVPIKQLLAGK